MECIGSDGMIMKQWHSRLNFIQNPLKIAIMWLSYPWSMIPGQLFFAVLDAILFGALGIFKDL